MVQYGSEDNSSFKKIVLSSSFLCEDKCSETIFDGIVSIIKRIKDRYDMFLKEIGDSSASRYPMVDSIGLHKMANSLVMSDNQTAALNVSSFIVEYIIKSTREYLQAEGEWSHLSEVEKNDIREIIHST